MRIIPIGFIFPRGYRLPSSPIDVPGRLAGPDDRGSRLQADIQNSEDTEWQAHCFEPSRSTPFSRTPSPTGEGTLKRTLTAWSLIALGIGAIIGAGLFVRTAAAIADRAGPSVTLAFIVAGVGCAFAGLCYAEFASMIPVSGSAYTYSYATMGELAAWIIGWDLVLEYAVGAATVAIAWSEYPNRVLEWFDMRIPYAWSHSPFESMAGEQGSMNIPAVIILGLLSALLIRGTKESAFVNSIIVVVKVAIVLMVIGIGWGYINPANHTPFIPEATTYVTPQGITHAYGGIMGILGAAGVVFFALHRLRRGLDGGAGSEESPTATCRSASSARW